MNYSKAEGMIVTQSLIDELGVYGLLLAIRNVVPNDSATIDRLDRAMSCIYDPTQDLKNLVKEKGIHFVIYCLVENLNFQNVEDIENLEELQNILDSLSLEGRVVN